MLKLNISMAALAAALMTTAPAMAAEHGMKSKTLPDVVKVEGGFDAQKPSIGFFGGYAQTESRRDATTFGVDYTMQPVVPFAFGGEVLAYVSHGDDKVPPLTRTRLLAKATYNFGGHVPIIKNSYVGLGVGPVFDNEERRIRVAVGAAPSVGFDIPLPDYFTNWSIGANASYTFLTVGEQFFAANGVLKYWF